MSGPDQFVSVMVGIETIAIEVDRKKATPLRNGLVKDVAYARTLVDVNGFVKTATAIIILLVCRRGQEICTVGGFRGPGIKAVRVVKDVPLI